MTKKQQHGFGTGCTCPMLKTTGGNWGHLYIILISMNEQNGSYQLNLHIKIYEKHNYKFSQLAVRVIQT